MVYFIHGFEWPYEKEFTVQINECNQPGMKGIDTKKVVFPVIREINSFREFYINNDTVYFDKLIYKYKNDEEIFNRYGFIYKRNGEDSFWESLTQLIQIISESNQKIKNIRIPLSVFKDIYEKKQSEKLLCKIFEVLSAMPRFDFFILLEKKSEVSFVYDTFNMDSFDKEEIFNKGARIVSRLDVLDDLLEPFIVLNKKLGFGICNFLQKNIQLSNYIQYLNNENSNYEKLKHKLKKDGDSNFSKEIGNPIKNFDEWFLKRKYVEYKRVFKWANKKNIDFNKTEKDCFFRLFGYIFDSKNESGKIPEQLRNDISKKTKDIEYSEIISKFEDFDDSMYEEIKSNCDEHMLEDFLLNWFNDDSSSWTIDRIKKFKLQKNLNKTGYNKKYSIERELLFYWSLYLNLSAEEAEILFELSDCTLKTSLLEDFCLLNVLKNVSNLKGFKEKAQVFITDYINSWNKYFKNS